MKKFLFLLLTTSLLFSGCTLAQQAQQKVEEQAAKSAIESMLTDIKDDLLRKHLAAQFSKKAYNIVSTSTGRGAETNTMRIQMVGDKTNIRTTTTDTKGKDIADYIMMGDTTYVKDFKDGAWWKEVAKKATEEPDTTTDFTPENMQKEFEKNVSKTTYKQLGKEACGTLTCYKYEESTTDNPEGKRTFWFDDKDYLLRKEELGFGEFRSTNLYSYDDVSVTAPTPTKDVPEGKSAFEMMYAQPGSAGSTGGAQGGNDTVPSQEEIDKLIQQYGGENPSNQDAVPSEGE